MFPSFIYWWILYFFNKLQFIFHLSLLSPCQSFLRFSHHKLILEVHYDCIVERETTACATSKNMLTIVFFLVVHHRGVGDMEKFASRKKFLALG